MNNDTMFSSEYHGWETPESLLDLVRQLGPIHLDPCTNALNPTGAANFFTQKENGLSQPWFEGLPEDSIVYMNSPYGHELKHWINKATTEFEARAQADLPAHLVMLVPSRTDTKWWAQMVSQGPGAVCFVKGRLKFKGASHGAPFPSAVVLYSTSLKVRMNFLDIFDQVGWCVDLC